MPISWALCNISCSGPPHLYRTNNPKMNYNWIRPDRNESAMVTQIKPLHPVCTHTPSADSQQHWDYNHQFYTKILPLTNNNQLGGNCKTAARSWSTAQLWPSESQRRCFESINVTQCSIKYKTQCVAWLKYALKMTATTEKSLRWFKWCD